MHHKKTRIIRSIVSGIIASGLLCCGSIYGAAEINSTPANSTDNRSETVSGMTTKTEIGSAQPAGINLQQLPSLIDIPQTPESIEKEIKLEDEGEKLFQQRLLDKALEKWQEAYGMSLEMKYAEGEGRALVDMARIFLERGQFVKAKYMGENAIEVLGGVADKKALGRAHLYLAQAYFGLDNPVWAGEQLNLAMKAFTTDGGNNAADTARLMEIAAGIIIKAGKIKEALQFLQAAASYHGQAGDNARCIACHIQVVDILLHMGLLTAAEEEAEKAISAGRSFPDQLANLTAALGSQANCKFALGEYVEAKKIYEQVLNNIKKIPENQMKTISKAHIYLGYGTTLSALREYERAKQTLEFALPVFKAAGASLPQAQAANTLGLVELELGHLDKAKELLEQALDLHNLITPKQDAFRVTVLEDLAIVESRLGHNRDARLHLESAAAQLRKIKEDTLLGRVNISLAEIVLKLAEETEAEKLITEAIKLSESMSDDSALWREYMLLAKIQFSQNNAKAAHESLQSAVSFFRSPQAGDFPSPERLWYPSTRTEAGHQLVQLLAQEKMANEVLSVGEQLKEESFLRDWHSCDGQLTGDNTELYVDLDVQRAHLHAAEASSPPSKIIKDWQNWLARFRSLATQNRQLAQLIAPVPMSAEDIAKIWQTNQNTVLCYFIGKDSSVLLTINKNGNINVTTLNAGAKQIDKQIASLLAAFGHYSNATDNAMSGRLLHGLYSELFPAAVREILPQSPQEIVTIVPDGSLTNLPFAALINDQNKFLIGEHTIAFSTSLANFFNKTDHYGNGRGILFVSSTEDQELLNALPASAVTYLNTEHENIKALQEQSRNKMAVQISDNLEIPFNALNTQLPLTQKEGSQTKAKILDLSANPLSCDLTVLKNVHIKNIDNREPDAVDPLCTIANAFNCANVQGTLINLWQQSSGQNEVLSEFYKNQLDGMNPAAALRKSELSVLVHHPHPADWATFQFFSSKN